ncbi:MAG TPA: LytTR family DNA-binding domain-containing protein [Chitinispirillaceae bacterium]|nr:LytTR family DNA-binding domain-containing protein [Chitinispirillaceae bacterium]
MRTIIIEDEDYAARRLENMVLAYNQSIDVAAKIQSVKGAVAWLKSNPHPDLIFLDIQLDDDLSFAIFDEVDISSKIIFTTAFDEYAIRAFKLMSIDYLLKPVEQMELNAAIAKFESWNNENIMTIDAKELRSIIEGKTPHYRERFSVSSCDKIVVVNVADIAYFFSVSGITVLVTTSKQQYSINLSLDALKEQLNPQAFFRVNRQYVVNIKAISRVHLYPKSQLKLEMVPPVQDDLFVSIDKVPEFKRWMDGL